MNNSVIGNVENVYMNTKKVTKNIVQPTDIHITQEQVYKIDELLKQIVEILIKLMVLKCKYTRT